MTESQNKRLLVTAVIGGTLVVVSQLYKAYLAKLDFDRKGELPVAMAPIQDTAAPPPKSPPADPRPFPVEPSVPAPQIEPAQPLKPTPGPELQWLPTAFEQALIDEVNATRARNSLDPLRPDIMPRNDWQQRYGPLMATARSHCLWMEQAQALEHSSGPYRENIARGHQTCAEVVADWMNDKGHRDCVLSRSAQYIGATGYQGPKGPWWVMQVGN